MYVTFSHIQSQNYVSYLYNIITFGFPFDRNRFKELGILLVVQQLDLYLS